MVTTWDRVTKAAGRSRAVLPLRARRWARWRWRARDLQAALLPEPMRTICPTRTTVKADPFGTDTLSCYVRFATTDLVAVTYEVAGRKKFADSPKVDVFSRTPHGDDTPATEHEFKVIGLIPNHKNTVTLTCTAQDGTSRTSTFTIETPALKGEEEKHLTVTAGESNTPLADGLFAILGNDSSKLDFMYLYDNAGQIRGEVPIIGYRSHRLLFPGDGSMIMSVSTTKLAQINAIGQVVNVWSTGDYELHHDYAFDDDGNLLVLASHAGSEADLDVDRAAAKKDKGERVNVEDLIIKIDIATGGVSLAMDLGDIFPDLKARAKVASDGDLDWIHINTIQWLGDSTVLDGHQAYRYLRHTHGRLAHGLARFLGRLGL